MQAEVNMNRFALLLTAFILAGMVYDAIDSALKPYEATFFTLGGYVTLAFICWLMGRALDERLHRMETQGTGQARRG
jgi:hypothetical protein